LPKYDFKCRKCDFTFEAYKAIHEIDNPSCPKCAHTKTEKLLSVPAIAFKGSGFYKTDHSHSAKDKPVLNKAGTVASPIVSPVSSTPTNKENKDNPKIKKV